jgi:hypothetical protein
MPNTSRRILLAAALALAGAAAVGIVAVAGQGAQQRVTPGEVKWPTTAQALAGTSGVPQTVILKGDPTKAGSMPFCSASGPTRKSRACAPDDRVATVVSGTWHFSCGRVR